MDCRSVSEGNEGRDIPPLASLRVAGNINVNKVFLVAAIGITLLGSAVAVAAAGSIPLSERSVFQCSNRPSNGTSAPTAAHYPLTAAMANYVYHGRSYSEDPIQVGISEVDRLLKVAAEQEHPLERARHFYEARSVLQNAPLTPQLQAKITNVLHEEIQALQEAAEAAPKAQDKLYLIRRGLEEVNICRPANEHTLGCVDKGANNRCFDEASLWKQAAEVYLPPTFHWKTPLVIPELLALPHFMTGPTFLAATCLRKAAHSLRASNDPDVQEERMSYIDQAIKLQKEVDWTHVPDINQARFHEELAKTYSEGWSLSGQQQAAVYAKGAVEESLNAYRLYAAMAAEEDPPSLSKFNFQLRAATQLMYAGNFADSLSAKLEFYLQAYDLIAKPCKSHSVGSKICADLLNRLSHSINQVEAAIQKEASKHLISRIFYGITGWFRR